MFWAAYGDSLIEVRRLARHLASVEEFAPPTSSLIKTSRTLPMTTVTIPVSQRIEALQASATIAMAAKARELKASGQKVYDFSLGEPDFATPRHICEAAKAAIDAGHTHYTPAAGIPQLREAIAQSYQQQYDLKYSPQQVVVSNGAKHSVANALAVLLNPGDQVIIPAPYWVSYAELVRLSGGEPVVLPTSVESEFKVSASEVAQAVSDRTRVLLLCSPSNPTGATYTPEELQALADVAIKHDLAVISDEIYDRLVYDNRVAASFATVRPGLAERTIVVNGVSKCYAMTGWRIGWTLSPPALAAAMTKLQSQQTSNPCSISQHAALAALQGPQDCVEQMRVEFNKRRDWVAQRLEGIAGLSAPPMQGAFYAFVDLRSLLGKDYQGHLAKTSADWSLQLLQQQQVATVMGSAFGAEGYARISYAAAMDVLEEGFERIERFVRSAA